MFLRVSLFSDSLEPQHHPGFNSAMVPELLASSYCLEKVSVSCVASSRQMQLTDALLCHLREPGGYWMVLGCEKHFDEALYS